MANAKDLLESRSVLSAALANLTIETSYAECTGRAHRDPRRTPRGGKRLRQDEGRARGMRPNRTPYSPRARLAPADGAGAAAGGLLSALSGALFKYAQAPLADPKRSSRQMRLGELSIRRSTVGSGVDSGGKKAQTLWQ
jgi:hypothetical protein